MKILYAEEFYKQFQKLPQDIQRFFRKQESIFKINVNDPRLHVKKLKGNPLLFSFRITRRYRVLFIFTDQSTAVLVTIGHRKDVYD